ncbi:hypothetical protein A2767_05675 [Candidatus Roizmanbacteria bacterium RIFCSPHIGHO2_01_FULL_35_10]|nr:MAG: hypothetical protein A2767_05675 [Candidatus Roizmanbacteria bacterium RIFCSPHIGHO2_01_FULL_35_10]
MVNKKPGQSKITTKLRRNAAKNLFLLYMKETSVFRNDEISAFILGKSINQVVLDSSYSFDYNSAICNWSVGILPAD